jgi:hypothetical protein
MRFWPNGSRFFVGLFDYIRLARKYKRFPTIFVDILFFVGKTRTRLGNAADAPSEPSPRRSTLAVPYYIPYFQVGTGGRKPTRKFFRKRAVLFGKLAANRAFRPSLEEKTIQKIERQPI